MVIGSLFAIWFYLVNPKVPVQLAKSQDALYQFLLNKWYFDEIYNFLFVRPALWLGRRMATAPLARWVSPRWQFFRCCSHGSSHFSAVGA